MPVADISWKKTIILNAEERNKMLLFLFFLLLFKWRTKTDETCLIFHAGEVPGNPGPVLPRQVGAGQCGKNSRRAWTNSSHFRSQNVPLKKIVSFRVISISDADPVELLYGSGSRIRKSSIQIRIRIQGKNFSQNSIFQNFVEKSVLT